MAMAPRWLSLMLLGILVLVAGVFGWFGRERISDLSDGGSARRSLGEATVMRSELEEAHGAVEDPDAVAAEVHMAVNNHTGRRSLGYLSCGTGNPIDDCWRCDSEWQKNRKRLADCGIGFGRNAIGGRDGRFYVVTDSSDDDAVNPRPGTLRHAVIQDEPLWIVFKRDMVITLKQELIMNSFKTIDGRGVNVHIANGACITIQFITNIIIHGLHIHDCKPTGNAMVRSSPSHYGWRTIADGDAVSIFGSSHIWVDQCSLSNCADGLVDAIMGSTAITISNNYFTHHNEVIASWTQ
ncbi:putative pectate lyase [Dioscorea sansibarensis]